MAPVPSTASARPQQDEATFSICFVSLPASPLFSQSSTPRAIGGAEVQQYLLSQELVARGYPVSFIIKDDPLVTVAAFGAVRLIKSFWPGAGLPVLRVLHPQITSLWRAMRAANAQVYYVRGAKFESGIVALFCRIHRRRMVQAVAHDNDCAMETLHNLRNGVKKRVYIAALRSADLVFAQTSHQQHLLRDRSGVESVVIGNVMPAASAANLEPKGGIRKALWVATLKPIKRPEVFLELAARLPGVQFTMVGPKLAGLDGYYQEMVRLAEAMDNVEFVPYVPLDKIGAYFADCDVFVLTSRNEGFPNVLLQAWAYGKPVVSAFDPDGIIARHHLGFVADGIEQFAEIFERFAQDPAGELAMLGQNGARYIVEHHSAKRIVGQFVDTVAMRIKPPADEVV